MNTFTISRTISALAAALSLAASVAHAVTFNFTEANGASLGASPYGSVTLTQSGSTVDFTVTLFNSNQFVKTGAGDFMNFKFNATGVALGDITIDAHTPTLTASTGAFSGSFTGDFGFGITNAGQNGGAGKFATNIVFHVANSLVADFTTANAAGYIFTADIIAPTGATGPVGAKNSNATTVPDGGSTVILLGSICAAFAFARRFLGR